MTIESTQDVVNLLLGLQTALSRVAEELSALRSQQTAASKHWFTTKEFAEIVGKSDDYVRELCREGRLRFSRTKSGRGGKPEFRISAEELARYQAEGPLRRISG